MFAFVEICGFSHTKLPYIVGYVDVRRIIDQLERFLTVYCCKVLELRPSLP